MKHLRFLFMIILITIGIVLLLELGLPLIVVFTILGIALLASTIYSILYIRETNRLNKIVEEMWAEDKKREEEENA